MAMNDGKTPPRPRLLLASAIVAALLLPSLWLPHQLFVPANCGDGLCGFWELLLVWSTLALISFSLAVVGFVRGERAWWLALLALLLLVGPVGVLAV